MAYSIVNKPNAAQGRPSQSLHGDLTNQGMAIKGGRLGQARVMWNFFFNKPVDTRPSGKIPTQALTRAQLMAAPNNTVYRLGHSTVLMKLNDAFWITDPMFSNRASPVQFAGPERFHQPPISIDELPPLKAVIISHDHYDHLDHNSIMRLAGKTEYFLTPRGVGDLLADWGVPAAKVRQLGWWQETDVDGVRFAATPARHFSGRGPLDRNKTLWASWVIIAGDQRIFFSGDSGYFDGFRQIGSKYGPFAMTMLETGAYNENWPEVHMQPEETIQAHVDLKGKRLLPIHNGTFDLAMHSWHEPLDRIVELGATTSVSVVTPRMGEPVNMLGSMVSGHWWEYPMETKEPEQARIKSHVPASERL